eukprot:7095179-Pyramimonas_sp.AAC.1
MNANIARDRLVPNSTGDLPRPPACARGSNIAVSMRPPMHRSLLHKEATIPCELRERREKPPLPLSAERRHPCSPEKPACMDDTAKVSHALSSTFGARHLHSLFQNPLQTNNTEPLLTLTTFRVDNMHARLHTYLEMLESAEQNPRTVSKQYKLNRLVPNDINAYA